MLRRLRLLLHRKGRLSSSLIDETPGMPSVSALVMHFGSLRAPFERIGYVTKRDGDWLDRRDAWAEVTRKHAIYTAQALASSADIVAIDHTVQMNGKPRVMFMVARQAKELKPGHAAHWRVYRRQKVAADMLAVLRLDAGNREIADCVLVPSSAMTKRYLRLSTVADLPPQAVRVESVEDLVQALKTRLRNLKRRGRR